jgi:glycosyltransferase involved in cell wall biosynthesis
MNIWLIQTGEDIPYGNDIRKLRTAVLAEELVRRGHEVTWWAASFSHLKKQRFNADKQSLDLESGVRVELLHGPGYATNVSLARVIDHRVVARQFRRRSASLQSPDCIVCALPPYDLAYQAALYAGKHDVPLIVDARDYWPDIFLDVAPRMSRPLLRAVLWSEFRMTRLAFRQARAITAMSEDVLEWALGYCERERDSHDRVFHLGFRRPPEGSVASPDWLDALGQRFVVAFIGTFSHFHSPLVLARAARLLHAEGRDDIAIVIAGAGGESEDAVRAEAADLPNVTMPGWLDQGGIDALLSKAAVGVCPTAADARFFPNKTFLYFSRGLPVLSAFRGELKSVLENDGLGFYFGRGDAEALSERIKELCDDRDQYASMQERVRKAFSTRYDEQVVYRDFATHIESVAGRSSDR